MFQQLIPFYSILLMNGQRLSLEVFGVRRKRRVDDQWFILDIFDQLIHGACIPRSPTMHQLIKHKPYSPNIALTRIRLSFKQLQRHVKRCPDCSLILHLLGETFFGEPEISDLHLTLGDKYIGRFHIAYHNQ